MSEAPREGQLAGARERGGIWILAAAQAISGVGNGIAAIAIPWFVLETTDSPARMGLVAAVTAAAAVVAGVLGGAAIDRLGFQRTSVLSDVMSGLSVLLIPLLHFAGVLEFWHIVLLAAFGALFDIPGFSARQSMVPALSARAGMPIERGNSIQQVASNAATSLIGPGVAGMLIAVFSTPIALYFDVASFAVAIVLVGLVIAPLPRVRAADPAERTSYMREVLDGAAHIFNDRVLRAVFPVFMMANLLFSPFIVIFAVIARDDYGSAWILGAFFSAFGLGAVVGTVVFGAIGHRIPRYRLFVTSIVTISAAMTGFAFIDPLVPRIGSLVVGGSAIGMMSPMISSLFQTRTPQAMLGRVNAMSGGLQSVLAPVSLVGAGLLIESSGVDAVLVVVIAGAWVMACYTVLSPTIRRAAPAFEQGAEGAAVTPVER